MEKINIDLSRKIPQVLFLGNGLLRACGGQSWDALLQTMTKRSDLPSSLASSMPLRAILITGNQVQASLKSNPLLYGTPLPEDKNQPVRDLLAGGFDHILTTNYSYELEAAAQPDALLVKSRLPGMMKNVSPSGRADSKYLLSTYNEFSYQGVLNRIWHIHGEARKPGSIVIDHNAYAMLLGRYIEHMKQAGHKYIRAAESHSEFPMYSWLDAFITGDVYFLGFGLDYSEIDIWWLMERKAREQANVGKIHYFDIGTVGFNEKQELLKALGCQVHNCGFVDRYGAKIDYLEFYKAAIQEILRLQAAKNPVPAGCGA